MENKDIINFFNKLAPDWDKDNNKSLDKVNTILDYANIKEGMDVLDVGCGTGILVEDYKTRKVNSITGLDISDEMIKLAKQKYPDVKFVCGHALEFDDGNKYDAIVMYNCFPHITDKDETIKHQVSLLKDKGRIEIAFSGSIKEIIEEHENVQDIAHVLTQKEMRELFEKYLTDIKEIDGEDMYVLVGTKK